jgi:hypothetical protein
MAMEHQLFCQMFSINSFAVSKVCVVVKHSVNGQSECCVIERAEAKQGMTFSFTLKTGQGVFILAIIATKYNRAFTIFIVNVRNVPISTYPDIRAGLEITKGDGRCDGHIVRSNVFLLGRSQFWRDKYLPKFILFILFYSFCHTHKRYTFT